MSKIPFYGVTAVCGEDTGVRRCLERFSKPILTYGFSRDCDIYADEILVKGVGSRFRVRARARAGDPHQDLGIFELGVPGVHNVLNSLAAIAIAFRSDFEPEVIRKALSEFRGVKRRFEIRWRNDESSQIIVDDYGHHPTEINATLRAARAFWPGRIVTVFQPHRFSRTLSCHEGFLSAFEQTDLLLITDIYGAGEDPIEGVHSKQLAEDIRKASRTEKKVSYVGDLDSAALSVNELFRPGDLVLCLGAGSITRLPDQIVAKEHVPAMV